ncbi:5'-nucleotidase C-terminal domain-containing protein [Cecembia lonarensis]|uniref:Endonuclease YhcR n=1 Tax=Cecembia lonarensis (strain CCUG 58316 / KCTC 22772 / LW9) TaxID=1225176 RepID=K1L194_CECL9|nr:5'-nucleotidase [Cecembia lonarensis]EKB50160.1 Endonuclease YhcR precursor [Cecembia lonarensis LW9]
MHSNRTMAGNKFYQILFLVAGLFLLTNCKQQLYKSGSAEFLTVSEEIAPDPFLDDFIQSYKTALEVEMNKIIGETDEAIIKSGPGETALGNLVADFQKEFAEQKLGQVIDISIINNGGLRNNLPKGPITLGNIYELSPFDNYLHILELNAEDVRALASFAVNRRILGIAGMSILAKDGEIIDIKVGNKALVEEKNYTLAVNDYLANGGDGMELLTQLPRLEETNILLRELLIDRIKHKTDLGQKITAKVEGRQKLD